MDIEKLIEQLRYLADTPSYTAFHDAKEREIICDQCEADFCYDKQQDAHWCMYEALSRAATALSTLQGENAQLRTEVKRLKSLMDEKGQDLWSAENQRADRLEAELNDLKAQWDMYGGDEGITSTFAKLEQVKAERDAAVKVLSKFGCRTCTKYNCFARNGEEDCHWEFYGQKED